MHLTTQWVILKLSWNPWFGLLLVSPDRSFSFITLHVLSNKETKIKMNLGSCFLYVGPCVNQQSITVLANSHQVVSQELTHQIDE